jgi:hypothetical protein
MRRASSGERPRVRRSWRDQWQQVGVDAKRRLTDAQIDPLSEGEAGGNYVVAILATVWTPGTI